MCKRLIYEVKGWGVELVYDVLTETWEYASPLTTTDRQLVKSNCRTAVCHISILSLHESFCPFINRHHFPAVIEQNHSKTCLPCHNWWLFNNITGYARLNWF